MAVALYARVSTAKQAEKDLSIPDQLKQMRQWCEANGYTVAEEYIEAGASATDDRRPAFQKMIHEATVKPSPYEAIIVHSLSRFFRDAVEFGLYERMLKKAGSRLISITQQTGNDNAGEMARQIFSVFDEYQSRENSKHTLRAMKENAINGNFNGSKPTFGFKVVESEGLGNGGNRKKRLAINEEEAPIVRQVFTLYLHGHHSPGMGVKQIATYLNQQGITLRGRLWTKGRVHEVLANRTYMGEFHFNKRDAKNQQTKPQSEWIKVSVEPIVDAATFQAVQDRKASRLPSIIPAKVVSSPTLLTGVLKCGRCGAGMTLMTGKSGKYRYYKCNTRIGKGNHLCDNPAIPMKATAGTQCLADKVLAPARKTHVTPNSGNRRYRKARVKSSQRTMN
jgi:DNA invertase Pin-like site-specific DNA recombinase